MYVEMVFIRSCLFRLFFGLGGFLFFLGLVVLIVIRAVVGVGRLGPLVHVACFASRAAFSRMSVGHDYVSHARAVRFVHAFCCDIVVQDSSSFSALLSLAASVLLLFLSLFSVLLTVLVLFLLSSSSVPLFLCGSCSHLCYLCIFWPFWGSDCRRSLVCCGFMLCIFIVFLWICSSGMACRTSGVLTRSKCL